ncbi:hypothetical protein E2C01_023632 [Portunus trituberculatus]|uniref:Uncharacterized protein n=1 Tax=Portunus trituberculatus TaxID=210409 RepID=A0A5B7E8F8_PORTR|nr:hypothetical protein [Portunus trituberculatus]
MLHRLSLSHDCLPTELRSSIVYKFSCPSCQAGYSGSTIRVFKIRVDEHKGQSSRTGRRSHNPPHSAVRDHSENDFGTTSLVEDVSGSGNMYRVSRCALPAPLAPFSLA